MNETSVLLANLTEDEIKLNDVSSLLVADLVINMLIVTLTIAVNACLIAIEIRIWKNRKRISQPKMLILFLAGTDILCSLLGILPKMFIFFHPMPCLHASTVIVYKFAKFCSHWFFFLSKLMVVLMGIERCISIRAPFFYIRRCTLKVFCITELVLVVYALLFAITSVYFEFSVFEKAVNEEQFSHFGCHELFLTFENSILNNPQSFRGSITVHIDGLIVLQIVQDFTLVAILFLCNMLVIFGLRDMQRRINVTRPEPSDHLNKEPDMMMSTGKEFSRLMLAIIVVFIILITPSAARKLCNQLGVLPSHLADFVCHHIAASSTFTNPFMYGLLRRKIRYRIALRLVSCCGGWLPESLLPVVRSSQLSDTRQFMYGRSIHQTHAPSGQNGGQRNCRHNETN